VVLSALEHGDDARQLCVLVADLSDLLLELVHGPERLGVLVRIALAVELTQLVLRRLKLLLQLTPEGNYVLEASLDVSRGALGHGRLLSQS
jgi:hypothetical protein